MAFAVEKAADVADNGLARQFALKSCQLGFLLPAGKCLGELLPCVLAVGVVGGGDSIGEIADALRPLRYGRGLLPKACGFGKGSDKCAEAAEYGGVAGVAVLRPGS